MALNYLERIVVSGSRRGAPARPAFGGRPPMPALIRSFEAPAVKPFGPPFPEVDQGDEGNAAVLDDTHAAERRRFATPKGQHVPAARPVVQGEAPPAISDEPPLDRPPALQSREDVTIGPTNPASAISHIPPGAVADDPPSYRAVGRPAAIRMPAGLRRPSTPPATIPRGSTGSSLSGVTMQPLSGEPRPREASATMPEPGMPNDASVETGSSATANATATGYSGSNDPLSSSFGPQSQRAEAFVSPTSATPSHHVASVPPRDSASASAEATIVPVDPTTPFQVGVQDAPPRPTAGEAFGGDPGAHPPAHERSPIVPEPTRLGVPSRVQAVKAKAENYISIGRIEVQVNNLSPQAPVVTSAASPPPVETAFLPGSYLDRFSLRP
jgi:hypothetical protein